MAGFEWTPRRDQAAFDVADDILSNEEIAAKAGVKRQTLDLWKTSPVFRGRVDQHREAIFEQIQRTGIAVKQNRIRRLNRDWQRMQRLVDERAAAAHIDTPGADTGLLAEDESSSATGRIVINHRFDAPLMKELRAHEEQAAKELGQWVEKSEAKADVHLHDADTALDGKLDRLAAQFAPGVPGEPDG